MVAKTVECVTMSVPDEFFMFIELAYKDANRITAQHFVILPVGIGFLVVSW